MRISWHAFAVSVYCSLMVTSGFTTIKLPVSLATPVAGAEAAATRQVQIGIQSLGFSADAISFPPAPGAAAPKADLPAVAAASASSEQELQDWANWLEANGVKHRVPASFARGLGLSDTDLILRSTKTVTGSDVHVVFVTDILGRKQVIFGISYKAENKGIMHLVGMDGVVEKAAAVQNGNAWNVPLDESRRAVENERALWRMQLAGIGNS